MLKNKRVALLLLILLTPLIPLIPAFTEEPEPMLIAGNGIENSPFYPPINFTETSEYVKLDNGLTYVVEFYKGTQGYNRICYQNGTVLVYNERIFLEYWSGSQWKQRGIPTHITWVQHSDTFYEVTRHYTDYIGTTYNVTYSVRTGEALKMTVYLESGQTDEYNLKWEFNGITQESYTEYANYTVFGDNETDTWLGVNWEDVYLNLGNITTTSIESHAQGKKLDVSFNIGTVESGQKIFLDPVLLDSYSTSNQDQKYDLKDNHPSSGSDNSAGGQAFDPGGAYAITSAQFYLEKVGSPTGNAHAVLYAMTGTYGSSGEPTGSPLATSDDFNVASLTGDYVLRTFTFSGDEQYEMQADTYYCIVFECPPTGTVNIANFIHFGMDYTSPTHDGNPFIYSQSAGWYPFAGDDAIFYVYGEEANTAPTLTSASILSMKNGDNVYTMDGYSTYRLIVNDLDTAADVAGAYLRGMNEAGVLWEVRATSLTGTPSWSIQSGADIIDLDTGSCSWSEDGNVGTADFSIRIEGDHGNLEDLELSGYVIDSQSESAGWTELASDYWDAINRLVTTGVAATDERINKGGTGTISGTVYYATTTGGNTASSYSPPNDQFTAVRIHDSGHTIRGSDTSIVNGAFSVSFSIPDAVQLNTYHAYLDMIPDWSDADAPDGDTVSISGDCIETVSVTFDDNRVNLGASVEVRYVLRYAYDSVSFTGSDGSIVGFSWDGANSWWDKAITAPSSPGADNYDENDLGVITDNNYGITAKYDVAGSNLVGDKYNVTDFWASNYYPQIGDNITLYAIFESEYDSHVCDGDDSLTIEDLSFTYDPIEEHFFAIVGKNESGAYYFDTLNSLYENTYNVTDGNMDFNISITWGGYIVDLFGLYYENGTYAGNVSISVYFEYSVDTFTLEGNATKGYVEIPLNYLWPLSGGASRTIYTIGNSETYYIFTPDSEYSAYSFTVKDYTGVIGDADSYLEILLNVNGTERLIERDLIWDTSNPVGAILVKNNRYKLQIRDGQGGVHVFDYFLPTTGVTPILIIDDISFSDQVHYVGEYISVEASRPDYEHIIINYKDEIESTTSIFVEICLMNGIQIWNATSTENMVQFNWYGADNETDYLVNLRATGEDYGEAFYSKALLGEKTGIADPPDLDAVLGSGIRLMISIFIIYMGFIIFSAYTATIGVFSGLTITYVLNYTKFIPIPIPWTILHALMGLLIMWALAGGNK